MEEPVPKNWSLVYMLRLGHKNLNLVFGGGYDGAFGLGGTPDFGTPRVGKAIEFKRKWEIEHTSIAKIGGDSAMCTVAGGMGGGGLLTWEMFTHFDPYDEDSTRGT